MFLIYVKTLTPRISYTFKHLLNSILGYEIQFTSKIEEFIAHPGLKISYGKKKLGNEFFVQQHDLLDQQGIQDIEINMGDWEGLPCFFKCSQDSDVPFDIFAASFFLLSRYEEYLPHVKDELGRFPFQESLAFKEDFLELPVIDLWTLKFRDLLENRFEKKLPLQRTYQASSIMVVQEVFKYKKKGIVRTLGALVRDIVKLQFNPSLERIKTLIFLQSDPYDIYDRLIERARLHKMQWTFFFQLSDFSLQNKNISFHKLSYQALIKSMGDYGVLGLLPGFDALDKLAILRKEKKRWENIVNTPLSRVLSFQYGVNLPQFYNNLDKLEISQDFSMGYPKHPGFRAGTCTPFLYYDINFERISPLTIHPYALSSLCFQEFSFFDIKVRIEAMNSKVREVNGKFLCLIENALLDPWDEQVKYLSLLEKLQTND